MCHSEFLCMSTHVHILSQRRWVFRVSLVTHDLQGQKRPAAWKHETLLVHSVNTSVSLSWCSNSRINTGSLPAYNTQGDFLAASGAKPNYCLLFTQFILSTFLMGYQGRRLAVFVQPFQHENVSLAFGLNELQISALCLSRRHAKSGKVDRDVQKNVNYSSCFYLLSLFLSRGGTGTPLLPFPPVNLRQPVLPVCLCRHE